MSSLLVALFLSPALAQSGESHAAEALAPVSVERAPIPEGPAVTISVLPGDDLQARIRALPAGSTVRLGAGTYAAPVHIDRPLTVEGVPGTVLMGQGKGTVLVIAADDVTLRGVRVTGGGADATTGDAGIVVDGDRFLLDGVTVDGVLIGIDVRQSDDGRITGSTIVGRADVPMGRRGDGIRLWESNRIHVERNHLLGSRDLVVWYSYHNRIAENHIEGCRYGTHFMHSDDNLVVGNDYDGDVVGVFVMYSERIVLRENRVTGAKGQAGVAFGFKESDDIEVDRNWVVGNTTGIYLDGTPHRIGGSAYVHDTLLAYNDTGLRMHGPTPGARFEGNELHENGIPVAVDGRSDALASTFEGNWWSDYAGYDLDRDGRGDVPYELRTLSGGLGASHPQVAFFADTPAANLLDFLAAAFPMLAPQPLVRDLSPRVGPSPLVVPARPE